MATRREQENEVTKPFTALTPIDHNGEHYDEGDEIHLSERSAKQLFELGAVVPRGKELDDYQTDPSTGRPVMDAEGKPVALTPAEKRARAQEEKQRLLQAEHTADESK